jgi:hypothetical protein
MWPKRSLLLGTSRVGQWAKYDTLHLVSFSTQM